MLEWELGLFANLVCQIFWEEMGKYLKKIIKQKKLALY